MLIPYSELVRLYRITSDPNIPNLPPRWNVAPSQDIPAVRLDRHGKRRLVSLRWGLIPYWAKDAKIGYRTINARAETVATAPAFREAFRKRRCLIPADGFYEWQKQGGTRQPYRVILKDGAPFALAGLWERWRNPENGEKVESCTIIVTDANELVAPLHDRMPVIIDPADFDAWLDTSRGTETAQALLKPYPAETMTAYPVSKHVNKPENDDPGCIEPVTLEPAADE